MVLFGVFVLYAAVLLPAWGNQRYTAGGLAPRVLTRLNLLIGIMIAIKVVWSTLLNVSKTVASRSGLSNLSTALLSRSADPSASWVQPLMGM